MKAYASEIREIEFIATTVHLDRPIRERWELYGAVHPVERSVAGGHFGVHLVSKDPLLGFTGKGTCLVRDVLVLEFVSGLEEQFDGSIATGCDSIKITTRSV